MRSHLHLVLLSFLLGLAGCSNKPLSFGERLMLEGETTVELAKEWERGKELSIVGEKLVRSGRSLVEKGRADLREGEQLIAAGNVEVQTSRQAYAGVIQTTIGVDSGERASNKVSELKKIAKAWERGEEKILKGSQLVKQGEETIAEGNEDILKGQQMIAQGRVVMQGSERRYINAK